MLMKKPGLPPNFANLMKKMVGTPETTQKKSWVFEKIIEIFEKILEIQRKKIILKK